MALCDMITLTTAATLDHMINTCFFSAQCSNLKANPRMSYVRHSEVDRLYIHSIDAFREGHFVLLARGPWQYPTLLIDREISWEGDPWRRSRRLRRAILRQGRRPSRPSARSATPWRRAPVTSKVEQTLFDFSFFCCNCLSLIHFLHSTYFVASFASLYLFVPGASASLLTL